MRSPVRLTALSARTERDFYKASKVKKLRDAAASCDICDLIVCAYMYNIKCWLRLFQGVLGSGYFELQVLSMVNHRGELKNGDCCGGGQRERHTNMCHLQCLTYFSVCLKEYQSNVTSTGACSFGSVDSPPLGGNSFTFSDPARSQANLVLPFTFRWTVSHTIFLYFFSVKNSQDMH